jgi:uncharacterized membrane protein
MKPVRIMAIAVVVISFAIALYFYPRMPEVMASHWNASGEVNGYMSRFWGLFLMPVISAVLLLLFIAIPNLDPLKKNINTFISYYDLFILVMLLFFVYIHMLTLLWNLGITVNIGRAMAPALGALFFFVGVLVSKSKRNYFIGIRTPWTLSSDKVWEKTHKLGGKLFKAAGILCVLGVFSDEFGIWLVLVPVIAAAIISVVYSYAVFRQST